MVLEFYLQGFLHGRELKSDQNGIEIQHTKRRIGGKFLVKIRPKWD
ncbi:hypothetical protein MWSIV6_1094 [Methanothermobacter wolfeii]|nr:hypothetical protein MWSIV6_1094 [Methanothermobacter wolfeii]